MEVSFRIFNWKHPERQVGKVCLCLGWGRSWTHPYAFNLRRKELIMVPIALPISGQVVFRGQRSCLPKVGLEHLWFQSPGGPQSLLAGCPAWVNMAFERFSTGCMGTKQGIICLVLVMLVYDIFTWDCRGKTSPVAKVDEGGSLSKGVPAKEGSGHGGSQPSVYCVTVDKVLPLLEAQLGCLSNGLD